MQVSYSCRECSVRVVEGKTSDGNWETSWGPLNTAPSISCVVGREPRLLPSKQTYVDGSSTRRSTFQWHRVGRSDFGVGCAPLLKRCAKRGRKTWGLFSSRVCKTRANLKTSSRQLERYQQAPPLFPVTRDNSVPWRHPPAAQIYWALCQADAGKTL